MIATRPLGFKGLAIAIRRPPNFDDIVRAFPKALGQHVIFCYGDTIFNPNGVQITGALFAHETVHSQRQGDAPADWWQRYIDDAKFRFDEELLAHQAEWQHIEATAGRHERRAMAKIIPQKLASPLYGGMISQRRAREMVTGAA